MPQFQFIDKLSDSCPTETVTHCANCAAHQRFHSAVLDCRRFCSRRNLCRKPFDFPQVQFLVVHIAVITQRHVPAFFPDSWKILRFVHRHHLMFFCFFGAFCAIFRTPSTRTLSADFLGALDGQEMLVVGCSGVAGTPGV